MSCRIAIAPHDNPTKRHTLTVGIETEEEARKSARDRSGRHVEFFYFVVDEYTGRCLAIYALGRICRKNPLYR
jgi:hypothetical protein